MIEVRQYIDRSGRNPFERWLGKLDHVTQFRVAQAIARISNGNFSTVKTVGRGVSELRLDFGPGYRIYYGKDGEALVILLGGGSNSDNKTTLQRLRPYGNNIRSKSGRNNATTY